MEFTVLEKMKYRKNIFENRWPNEMENLVNYLFTSRKIHNELARLRSKI